MTNKKRFLRFLIALPLIVLSACTVPGQVNQDEIVASVKGTLASELTLEANVAETLAVVLAPTTAPTQPAPPTEAPTPVPTQPAPTLAPTAAPAATQPIPPTVIPTMVSTTAKVSVSVDTNCRQGPSVQYPILGGLLVGEEAEIVGRLVNNSYWLIKNPDAAGDCWITGAYATAVGPYDQVPVRTAPPLPGGIPYTNPNFPYSLGKITLSSAQAVEGDSLTVKVVDFPANSSIDIRVGEINKAATLVFDGKVAANGTASHTFTVPAEADKGETWVVVVLTTDLANGTQASLPFYITN